MAQLEGAGKCKEKQVFKRVFLSISVKESCLFMSTFHMHSYRKLMLLAQELNGKKWGVVVHAHHCTTPQAEAGGWKDQRNITGSHLKNK